MIAEKLHPDVERLLDGILKPPPDAREPPDLAVIRAGNAAVTPLVAGSGEPVARVWNEALSLGALAGSVPARFFRPFDARPRRLLVYIHGGGWVNGTLDSYDALCRSLARDADALVVSIAYSLSPEAAPGRALDEVTAVLAGASALVAELARKSEIAAGAAVLAAGDSSGGHLLAAAIHRLIERGETAALPRRLAFIYPVTDASLNWPSIHDFGTGYSLTAARMDWYWSQYLGSPRAQADARDPEVSPLRSPHLDRFPPSLTVTAAFDPLRDEGEAFAAKQEQGELLRVPGQIHGFIRFRNVLHDPENGPDAITRRIGAFLAAGE